MAIIQPPAQFNLRGAKWRLNDPVQVNRSAWTGRRKVVGLPGAAMWTVSGEFVPIISEARAKVWRAFFISLRSSANRFRIRATENRQTATANPTVAAGAGNATTLPLQGLPVSSTVLQTGDMLTVTLPSGHARLVMLNAPLVSDTSGAAIASFDPEMGEVPTVGAAVEMQWPYALVALTSEPTGWDIDTGQIYNFQITAEEAL